MRQLDFDAHLINEASTKAELWQQERMAAALTAPARSA
jgi:hypothetical protein